MHLHVKQRKSATRGQKKRLVAASSVADTSTCVCDDKSDEKCAILVLKFLYRRSPYAKNLAESTTERFLIPVANAEKIPKSVDFCSAPTALYKALYESQSLKKIINLEFCLDKKFIKKMFKVIVASENMPNLERPPNGDFPEGIKTVTCKVVV